MCKPTLHVFKFAFLLLVFFTAFGYGVTAEGASKALLIGINDYQRMSDLNGAVNDVEKMRSVLTTRYGFSDTNIRVLVDEDATRQGILDAFEELVVRVDPGDIVYVHFSGHGSRVADLNGDETEDGKDETIVPHDGRTDGVPDITDDELGEFIARLQARYVLIVLDSCHSGTATRGVSLQARFVPEDDRTKLYNSFSPRAVVPIETNHVLMTGASAGQSALDGPVGPSGTYYGLFTLALATALTEAQTPLSPREIENHVHRFFARLQAQHSGTSLPEPQFEGPEELLGEPLFASASELPGTSTPVYQAADGTVSFGGAADSGPQPGSYWAIFPPGVEAMPGSSVAVAHIEASDLVTLYPNDVELSDGAYATPAVASMAFTNVRVRLEGIGDSERAEVRSIITSHVPGAAFVSGQEFAHVVFIVSGNRCETLTFGGLHHVDTFEFNSAGDLGATMAEVLVRSQISAKLGDFYNPTSDIALDVRTLLPESAEARSFKAVATGEARAYKIRRPGDPRSRENSLVIELTSNQDCYITIVNVDSEGRVNMLFPNPFQEPGFLDDGFITGGTPVHIPDVFEGGTAGFAWDCSPPTGMETIQVFACADLTSAQTMRRYLETLAEQSAVIDKGNPKVKVGDDDGSSSRGIPAQFETVDALGLALAKRWLPRGFKAVSTASDSQAPPGIHADWTSASLTVLVEE